MTAPFRKINVRREGLWLEVICVRSLMAIASLGTFRVDHLRGENSSLRGDQALASCNLDLLIIYYNSSRF